MNSKKLDQNVQLIYFLEFSTIHPNFVESEE